MNELKKVVAFSVSEEILNKLEKLAEGTMIPKSRLVERAIIDFLEEYEEIDKMLNNLPSKGAANENK